MWEDKAILDADYGCYSLLNFIRSTQFTACGCVHPCAHAFVDCWPWASFVLGKLSTTVRSNQPQTSMFWSYWRAISKFLKGALFIFETGSISVAQAGLTLMIFLHAVIRGTYHQALFLQNLCFRDTHPEKALSWQVTWPWLSSWRVATDNTDGVEEVERCTHPSIIKLLISSTVLQDANLPEGAKVGAYFYCTL